MRVLWLTNELLKLAGIAALVALEARILGVL